jgi:hypothetical protein
MSHHVTELPPIMCSPEGMAVKFSIGNDIPAEEAAQFSCR